MADPNKNTKNAPKGRDDHGAPRSVGEYPPEEWIPFHPTDQGDYLDGEAPLYESEIPRRNTRRTP